MALFLGIEIGGTKVQVAAAPPVNSPFAALAALKEAPPPARRPRRRRKPKAARSQAS